MQFNAQIIVHGDAEKIYQCIKPEMMDYERSSFTIKKEDNKLIFDVNAKDSVALRATLNAITQALTIYEKIKKNH